MGKGSRKVGIGEEGKQRKVEWGGWGNAIMFGLGIREKEKREVQLGKESQFSGRRVKHICVGIYYQFLLITAYY